MSSHSPESWPTVQLLHELPDGSAHVDWLLGTDPDGQRPLITFRLPRRVDELRAGETMDAQRIADHRPAYLTYEGPISGGRGGRGTVRRLRAGQVAAFDPREPVWLLVVIWESDADAGVHQRLRLDLSGPACRIVAESP
jgi:hypothetical protein